MSGLVLASVMDIKPIIEVAGAFARSDGMIKFPESKAIMPHGGERTYKTVWKRGTVTKASKTARHKYYGTVYKGKNYKIHRLICRAFHGDPPEGKNIVLHLDENALNNEPSNLRWGTQKENLNAENFLAYCRTRTGKDNPRVKGNAKKQTQ